MDTSPIMFKAAINGFDKKAVISYIFELNETNQAAQKRLTEQLEQTRTDCRTMDQQLQDSQQQATKLASELELLSTELEGERTRTGEMAEQIEELRQQIQSQQRLIDEKEQEAMGSRLSQTEMQGRFQQLEEKKLEVERASAQIGRLLLDATADGDRMRTEAQAEADDILERTRREAEEILAAARNEADASAARARVEAERIVAGANTALDEANNKFKGFRQEMLGIQRTITDAVAAIEQKTGAITGVINILEERMIVGPLDSGEYADGTLEAEMAEESGDVAMLDGVDASSAENFFR